LDIVHSLLPQRSPAVALAAVMSGALLLAGCQGDPAEQVRPGPSATSAKTSGGSTREVGVAIPAPVATCSNAPEGWSGREDRRPGVRDLPVPVTNPGIGTVGGYLDSSAAVCGQTMSVHLSSFGGATQVRLRALRVGSYRGRGARLVWQSSPLAARRQPEAEATGRSRVIAERWPVAATFTVDAGWPPGFYLVEVVPVGHGRPSFIPLAVRTSGARAPYLVVVSDLTWLAYNDYGGRSLYFGPGGTHAQEVANRSYQASVDRPVGGRGLERLFSMDLPLIRFLSRVSVPFDVTTDSSLDAIPAQLVGQATVLIGGHSEYWTRRMYDAAVVARDTGTNFGFLGANEIYWQARIERNPGGRATTLTVYRDARLDPLARANPGLATVQWRHDLLDRDPASLVGVGMSVVGARGPYVVRTAPVWLFAGTGLVKGSVLPLAIGNEADAQEPPTGHSPANLQVLLHGVALVPGRTRPFLITAAYYSAPSGAGVFSAGTTYWVCNLDSTCPLGPTPRATSVAIQRITLHLITAFGAPRAGRLHPSVGTPYLSPVTLARTLPVGGTGPGGEG
jgi:hypothetical protein